MSEFAERVGIVVGGGGGIGRAVAEALAQMGARLAIVDRGTEPDGTGGDPEIAAGTVRALEALGTRAIALPLDATDPESARSAIAATKEAFGHVDFGVYCAGFHHERPLLRTRDDELARVLDLHLIAPTRFARELARTLVADKRPGSIVLATSGAAFVGSAGQSALATAAGGVVGFVRTAATELRRHDVRINAVVPTARTRQTAHLPLFASIRADSLTPEHVAQVVAHLLSNDARDVHGEAIGVAGGRIYTFRHIETSGAFLEGPPPSLAAIGAAWRDVTRR